MVTALADSVYRNLLPHPLRGIKGNRSSLFVDRWTLSGAGSVSGWYCNVICSALQKLKGERAGERVPSKFRTLADINGVQPMDVYNP